MKAVAIILLSLSFGQVLISADQDTSSTLHVSEERDASGHVTLVITPHTGKVNANPGKDFCVKIPGGAEDNFKPVDEKGHLFLLSADGKTFGCIEKFAVKSYRCDAVVLTQQGILQVYPDLAEKIRPYLKGKHLPVDADELFIESVEPRQVTLGGVVVRTKGETRCFSVQVVLKKEGGVEVMKSWFEKDE